MSPTPPQHAGRNAAVTSVVLCFLSLPIGFFAAPVLTLVSAPVSYLAADGISRRRWFRGHPWVAVAIGVAVGGLTAIAVLLGGIAVIV